MYSKNYKKLYAIRKQLTRLLEAAGDPAAAVDAANKNTASSTVQLDTTSLKQGMSKSGISDNPPTDQSSATKTGGEGAKITGDPGKTIDLIETFKQWLEQQWNKIKNIPNDIADGWEKIKEAYNKFMEMLKKYWDTIMKGDGKIQGAEAFWNNAKDWQKVLIILSCAGIICVLIYLLTDKEMITDAFNEFKKSMANIKTGIVKAFQQGTVKGVFTALINIFTAPFKIIMAAVKAIIDSGVGDILIMVFILFGITSAVIYYVITGQIPFASGASPKQIIMELRRQGFIK